jgi:uncharacterized protein (DUF849 family)
MIMIAPTGGRRSKADHPNLPILPGEVSRAAAACRESGAAAIHLHVRDRDGGHLLDAGAYSAMIAAVRAEAGADFVCQVSTELLGRYTPAQQMALIDELRPEACSIALRELFHEEAQTGEAADFLARHSGAGMGIQVILYDAGDMAHFSALKTRGAIPDRIKSVLFVLGRYAAGQRSDPRDLLAFLGALPADLTFTICAFGPREAACALTAAGLGGHSRVGFENNFLLPNGERASTNEALVTVVAEALPSLGLAPANTDEARHVLGCA